MSQHKILSDFVAGSKGRYFALTSWSDDNKTGIDLTLSDGADAYKTKLSASEIKTLAAEASMTQSEFFRTLIDALTSNKREKREEFAFEIKTERDRLQLTVKKVLQPDTIKFDLGTLTLTRFDSKETIAAILRYCVEELKEARVSVARATSEASRMSAERNEALKSFEKAVESKESLEMDLYSKFKLLLNAKKAKIRELKERVVPSATPELQQEAAEEVEEEEEERELDQETDDPDSGSEEKEQPRKSAENRFSLPGATQLLGEDSDQEEKSGDPLPKKRKTRKAAAASMPKPTTVKRVTRTTSSASASSTASTGSGSSRTRKKARHVEEVESLEAEDLMDCI